MIVSKKNLYLIIQLMKMNNPFFDLFSNTRIKEAKTSEEIRLMKEKIIDFLYLVMVVFMLPALFSVLLRSSSVGLTPLNYLQVGISVVLVLVFMLRNRLGSNFKRFYLLFIAYSLSVGGFLAYGIFSHGFFTMLLWVVFSYVLIDAFWGIINFVFFIIVDSCHCVFIYKSYYYI